MLLFCYFADIRLHRCSAPSPARSETYVTYVRTIDIRNYLPDSWCDSLFALSFHTSSLPCSLELKRLQRRPPMRGTNKKQPKSKFPLRCTTTTGQRRRRLGRLQTQFSNVCLPVTGSWFHPMHKPWLSLCVPAQELTVCCFNSFAVSHQSINNNPQQRRICRYSWLR